MSSAAPPLLRPLGIADFLDTAIRLYRQNFAVFLGIVAVVYTPVLVAQITFGYLMGGAMHALGNTTSTDIPWEELARLGPPYLGLLLLSLIALPLGQGALTIAVSRRYLNQPMTVGDAYRTIGARWLTILLALALVGFSLTLGASVILGAAVGGIVLLAQTVSTVAAVLLGMLIGFVAIALLLGLLYVALLCYFTTPAIVIEGLGPVAAIARSIELVKGYWWHCFGVLFLLSLLVGAVSWALSYPGAMAAAMLLMERQPGLAQAISQGLGVGVRMLVEPVYITGSVLLYYDLRVRKEGFDLELLARAMGTTLTTAPAALLPPPPPPAPEAATTAAYPPPPPPYQPQGVDSAETDAAAAEQPAPPPAPAAPDESGLGGPRW